MSKVKVFYQEWKTGNFQEEKGPHFTYAHPYFCGRIETEECYKIKQHIKETKGREKLEVLLHVVIIQQMEHAQEKSRINNHGRAAGM